MRDDDFGARTEAVARLPAAAQRRRVILAMGVLRESRAMSSAKSIGASERLPRSSLGAMATASP